MDKEPSDPLAKRAYAEALIQRTANQLQATLKELCSAASPFPAFMDMSTIQAVEAEPGEAFGPERGCVVVCPDGELYELTLGFVPTLPTLGGWDQVEEFKALDLSPAEYTMYAYNAIQTLTQILLDQERK